MGSVNFPTFFTKRVNRAIEQSRDDNSSKFIVSNSKIKFLPQLILFQLLLIYKYNNYSQMLQ
ncbi:MAG TPA: hypothetical protein PKV40_07930, partial [Candidatus Kapabacteria bacterium]|nr:hypothetical protein [Candidatus Kapabacteria bacterium]